MSRRCSHIKCTLVICSCVICKGVACKHRDCRMNLCLQGVQALLCSCFVCSQVIWTNGQGKAQALSTTQCALLSAVMFLVYYHVQKHTLSTSSMSSVMKWRLMTEISGFRKLSKTQVSHDVSMCAFCKRHQGSSAGAFLCLCVANEAGGVNHVIHLCVVSVETRIPHKTMGFHGLKKLNHTQVMTCESCPCESCTYR